MNRKICCPTSPNIPNGVWDLIKKLPTLRYMLPPVANREELYSKYSYRDLEPNNFAYVVNENTFYVWRECDEHFEHYIWKPITANVAIDNLKDIIPQIIKTNEDLDFDENKKLKFSDKEYNDNSNSGLGRVYLRQNIVNGENILSKDMITKPNTRYILQYNYDLKGETITIPKNCILDFQGAVVSNGLLVSDKIKVAGTPLLDNVEINNIVGDAYYSWFINDNETLNANLLVKTKANKIIFDTAKLQIDEIELLHSNTVVDLSFCEFKQNKVKGLTSVFKLKSLSNITIYNGIIDGNSEENHINTGPQDGGNHGISIQGCSNIYLYNNIITNCGSDGIYLGTITKDKIPYECTNIVINDTRISKCQRQGISVINIKGLYINNLDITNITGKGPGTGIDFEPNSPNEYIQDVYIDKLNITNTMGRSLMYQCVSKHPVDITLNNIILDSTLAVSTSEEVKDISLNITNSKIKRLELNSPTYVNVDNCEIDSVIRKPINSTFTNSKIRYMIVILDESNEVNFKTHCNIIKNCVLKNVDFRYNSAVYIILKDCYFEKSDNHHVSYPSNIMITGCFFDETEEDYSIEYYTNSNNIVIVNNIFASTPDRKPSTIKDYRFFNNKILSYDFDRTDSSLKIADKDGNWTDNTEYDISLSRESAIELVVKADPLDNNFIEILGNSYIQEDTDIFTNKYTIGFNKSHLLRMNNLEVYGGIFLEVVKPKYNDPNLDRENRTHTIYISITDEAPTSCKSAKIKKDLLSKYLISYKSISKEEYQTIKNERGLVPKIYQPTTPLILTTEDISNELKKLGYTSFKAGATVIVKEDMYAYIKTKWVKINQSNLPNT